MGWKYVADIKWWKLLGFIELLAGTIGLLWGVLGYKSLAVLSSLLIAEWFIFFALSSFAGVLLFEGSEIGRGLSVFVQALQVPHVSTGGFIFRVIAGPHVIFAYANRSLRWSAGAHLAFFVSPTLGEGYFYAGLNLVPILALFYLFELVLPSADTPNGTDRVPIPENETPPK